MVVILILALLTLLGNYASLALRREKTRIEELTVELTGLIDQEKTNALLGKTEGGKIVRKRKITISFNDVDTISYTAEADLAEDSENTYSVPVTPLKSWTYPALKMALYNCPYTAWDLSVSKALTLELTGDTMKVLDPTNENPHLAIQISRNETAYREIHIDRRTGLLYEKAGLSQAIECN